jgi:ribosomal protein L14E/L6E/L27E
MFRQDADLMGKFVISKAGHDVGECYVIVCAAGNDLQLANGKNRTIQKPKPKNRKHLSVTKRAVPDIELLLKGEPVSSNLKLAGLIKNFRKEFE